MIPPTIDLAFAAAVLVSGYLTVKCIVPPNPTPSKTWKSDGLWFYGNSFVITIVWTGVAFLFAYHATVAASPPDVVELICPWPERLNPELFSFNTLTASAFAAVLIGAPLRLGAFNNLGKSFTFGLAAPKELITDGIYQYIQHPSYTGIMIIAIANLITFGRWDGAIGCLIPPQFWQYIHGREALAYGIFSLIAIRQMITRVSQEEAMLREVFGTKWVKWHQSTKRFIPGIF